MSDTNTGYELKVFLKEEGLFTSAASLIIEIANKCIKERGRFTISLSGGHTPEKLYGLLSTNEYSKQIDWEKVIIFWGDERCVPLDDKDNNAHMARKFLLGKINIPVENIYPIPVNLPPQQAAREYESEITSFFGIKPPVFDLILLGIGDNAHTASLFPYTEVIKEKNALVKEVYIEEQKMFRVTMTAPLINKASNVLFLVTGKEKSMAMHQILNSPQQPDKYPAQLIKPREGKLYWFVDKEAASLLGNKGQKVN